MAFSSALRWRKVATFITAVLLFVLGIDCSPLHESLGGPGSLCPKGWYHYQRFCVAKGKGASDRAVAMYCDGFGGIGIKGLCIIKARVNSDTSRQDPEEEDHRKSATLSLDFSLGAGKSFLGSTSAEKGYHPTQAMDGSDESNDSSYNNDNDNDNAVMNPGKFASTLRDSSNALVSELDDEDNLLDVKLCPVGWKHYRSMCVYRPFTITETCRLLDSVEFHGLCLKHANTQALESPDGKGYFQEGKRICCCAHVKARGNRYGC
ncbi:uncharacterized protein LOC101847527 [Aplysia californica]|uniref:Uncharacterized protein LOC101847527 n=1 Tax=Aplysia californica TaxID=6500 RepID=A0ABM0K4H2_APLCA|nr:uncharacterized protein LOC101847527 [Aplysia californica]